MSSSKLGVFERTPGVGSVSAIEGGQGSCLGGCSMRPRGGVKRVLDSVRRYLRGFDRQLVDISEYLVDRLFVVHRVVASDVHVSAYEDEM